MVEVNVTVLVHDCAWNAAGQSVFVASLQHALVGHAYMLTGHRHRWALRRPMGGQGLF